MVLCECALIFVTGLGLRDRSSGHFPHKPRHMGKGTNRPTHPGERHSGRHLAANGGCHFLLSELLPVILKLNNQYKVVKTIYPGSVAVHLSPMKTWRFKLTCMKSLSMRNSRSELAMVARDGHKSTKTHFCK